MADVKKCDRCGKFFDRSKEGNFEGRMVMTFAFGEYWMNETAKMKKDLCKECADKLESWLKAGEDL